MDFLKKLLSGAKTAQPQQAAPQLRVQQGQGMQPFGRGQEDDYTPSAALENTGYYSPQTTQHSGFNQQGGMPMQGVVDPMNYARQQSRYMVPQQSDVLRKLLGY